MKIETPDPTHTAILDAEDVRDALKSYVRNKQPGAQIAENGVKLHVNGTHVTASVKYTKGT